MERINNPHDRFACEYFSLPDVAQGLFEFCLPQTMQKSIDLGKLSLEESGFPNSREADLLFSAPARVGAAETDVFLLFEHKSWHQDVLVHKLNGYAHEVRDRAWKKANSPDRFEFPPVAMVVLYHGDRPWHGPKQLADCIAKVPGFEGFAPRFDWILVDLVALSVDELPGRVDVRAALESLKLASERRLAEQLATVIRPLSAIDGRPDTAFKVSRIMTYAGSRGDLTDEVIKLSLNPFKKDRELIMSNMMKTWLEEGRLQGLEQGLEQGLQQGRELATREWILVALSRRFGDLPPSLSHKLQSVSNPRRLEELAEKAMDVSSLEEFMDGL